MKFLGIDGCRSGWFISGVDSNLNWSFHITDNLESFLLNSEIQKNLEVALIDIPIGLPGDSNARQCEKEARKILGGFLRDRNMDEFIKEARTINNREALKKELSDDDIIDSIALAIAAKGGLGKLKSLPEKPQKDAYGLPMQIMYC